jgi:CrcB protein
MTPAAHRNRGGAPYATRRQAGFLLAVLRCGKQRKGERGMVIYLWIAIGSALGGMARFWFGGLVDGRINANFPWGTVVVNITGSFVIGFLAMINGPDGRALLTTTAREFAMIGICGGYTTFSSFSLQTLYLARQGELFAAGWNIVLSVVCCLLAVWLGHIAAVALNEMR